MYSTGKTGAKWKERQRRTARAERVRAGARSRASPLALKRANRYLFQFKSQPSPSGLRLFFGAPRPSLSRGKPQTLAPGWPGNVAGIPHSLSAHSGDYYAFAIGIYLFRSSINFCRWNSLANPCAVSNLSGVFANSCAVPNFT